VIGLASALLAGPLHAADPAKAAVAEDKAEVLEEKVVNDTPPPKKAETLTPGEAQAVDPAGQAPLDDSITCLARTIYWEAKGADAEGMAAVANVVLNRLGHDGFPDTICGVVKQGVESKACQFSWWCDGRPDQVEEAQRYGIAQGNRAQGAQPAVERPHRRCLVLPRPQCAPGLGQSLSPDGADQAFSVLQTEPGGGALIPAGRRQTG
jgi:spore germination cell wall hydrolase CwlJ-like protein